MPKGTEKVPTITLPVQELMDMAHTINDVKRALDESIKEIEKARQDYEKLYERVIHKDRLWYTDVFVNDIIRERDELRNREAFLIEALDEYVLGYGLTPVSSAALKAIGGEDV